MTETQAGAPIWTPDQQGESIWTLGCSMTMKATAARTGGHLSVIDERLTPATRPPLHFHHAADEAWYVLEGRITFQVAGERYETGAGDFVFGPRTIPHTFAARSDEARMLIIYTPGGFEEYFCEVGEAAPRAAGPPLPGEPLTDEQIAELDRLASRYGCEIVGPPIAL